MSGVSIKRGENWLHVAHLNDKVSAHAGTSSVGAVTYFRLDLEEAGELLIHDGDVEVYVSLERLSELHETLGAFIEEAKKLLKGDA